MILKGIKNGSSSGDNENPEYEEVNRHSIKKTTAAKENFHMSANESYGNNKHAEINTKECTAYSVIK